MEQQQSVSSPGAGEVRWSEEHPVLSGVITVLSAVAIVAVVFVCVIFIMSE